MSTDQTPDGDREAVWPPTPAVEPAEPKPRRGWFLPPIAGCVLAFGCGALYLLSKVYLHGTAVASPFEEIARDVAAFGAIPWCAWDAARGWRWGAKLAVPVGILGVAVSIIAIVASFVLPP
jgi:hypothetical protein